MTKKITVIPGDGIGPEITAQVLRVLKALNLNLEFIEMSAGLECFEKTGELLPEKTLLSMSETGLALKGPTTTPIGKGHKSINVVLRQKFDLYANVRPVHALPNLSCVNDHADFTIVRENTEGSYIGVERMVDEDTAESIKRITRKASMRISEYAFELAQKEGRNLVTCVHKANIMKLSDGLFLSCFQEVAKRYPDIKAKDMIVDNCCMQMVTHPEQFQVIVTENLYGDIISDLGAGLVGGLGVQPGANIGQKCAMFEAVHGSAPDIAGQNKANPIALLQSAGMLLTHIGERAARDRIMSAIKTVLTHKEALTGDLGGKGSTESVTTKIIECL